MAMLLIFPFPPDSSTGRSRSISEKQVKNGAQTPLSSSSWPSSIQTHKDPSEVIQTTFLYYTPPCSLCLFCITQPTVQWYHHSQLTVQFSLVFCCCLTHWPLLTSVGISGWPCLLILWQFVILLLHYLNDPVNLIVWCHLFDLCCFYVTSLCFLIWFLIQSVLLSSLVSTTSRNEAPTPLSLSISEQFTTYFVPKAVFSLTMSQ